MSIPYYVDHMNYVNDYQIDKRHSGPLSLGMLVTARAPVWVITNLVSEQGSWSQSVYEITSGRVLFMGV